MNLINCRKCNRELEVIEYSSDDTCMYNSVYGCDSGCLYVRFEVRCTCGDLFETGEFGEYENDEDRQYYLDRFLKEYND